MKETEMDAAWAEIDASLAAPAVEQLTEAERAEVLARCEVLAAYLGTVHTGLPPFVWRALIRDQGGPVGRAILNDIPRGPS